MPTEETQDVILGSMRISKRLHAEVVAEQQRLKKLTGGIEPTLVDVIRMLIERGLANGKKR